jgi:hypothetical protein
VSAFRNLLAKLGLSRSEREQTTPSDELSEDALIRQELQSDLIKKQHEESERRQSEPPNKPYD